MQKSVNPDVTMDVIYANSWNDPTAEAQAAQALIDRGCDVLGQHTDSTATQTTAEAAGVWGVGYNSDMIGAAPNASLTSAIWDWSIYLEYAVNCVVNGEPIDTDWSGGMAEGVCDISPLNEAIVAEGTMPKLSKLPVPRSSPVISMYSPVRFMVLALILTVMPLKSIWLKANSLLNRLLLLLGVILSMVSPLLSND